MHEVQSDGTVRVLHQHAHCESREQVINWYGLNSPDIAYYDINEE